jgi:hypothetical protein
LEQDLQAGKVKLSALSNDRATRERAGQILAGVASVARLTVETGRTMPKSFEFSVKAATLVQTLAAMAANDKDKKGERAQLNRAAQECLLAMRPSERAVRALFTLGTWSKSLNGLEVFTPDPTGKLQRVIMECHAIAVSDGSLVKGDGLTDKSVKAVIESLETPSLPDDSDGPADCGMAETQERLAGEGASAISQALQDLKAARRHAIRGVQALQDLRDSLGEMHKAQAAEILAEILAAVSPEPEPAAPEPAAPEPAAQPVKRSRKGKPAGQAELIAA